MLRLNVLILSLLMIGQTFAQEAPNDASDYFLSALKEEYNGLLNSRYTLFPHKGTFLLPFTYNEMAHEDIYLGRKVAEPENSGDYYKKNEAEFQISFIIPVLRSSSYEGWDLLFAYTHRAWWQVYNSEWSRPFRETNYMPELFARRIYFDRIFKSKFRLTSLDFGYVHQSNGQTQLLSRSWDRIFARASILHDHFMANISLWYRLPEKAEDDDNKDIYNYMGYGELELIKSIRKHTFSLKVPIAASRFGSEIRYSHPWRDRLRWFVRFQAGYGHSLIEYDRPTQRYGVGIILEEFFDSR